MDSFIQGKQGLTKTGLKQTKNWSNFSAKVHTLTLHTAHTHTAHAQNRSIH